ncbi:MAG: exodeoxyribonuclease V subunit gamma [Clostridiales bacterium]|nr:exodeoxyribonuclease V subunit gamma [Clostridiales bacterium]
MSVQFVIGPSGSGKTYQVLKRMKEEALKNPKEKYLVLVPEQFTLQTQKELVEGSSQHAILNIDVLSFVRLAYQILSVKGGLLAPVLEDSGKNMLVRKVMREKKEELHVLGYGSGRMGMIEEVKSLLSEFGQYGIGRETLEQMIAYAKEQGKTLLSDKLEDMAVIRTQFDEKLEKRYMTSEGLLDALCHAMDEDSLLGAKQLRDAVIFLDGFTGFTPSQYGLLKKIFQYGKKVYVSITAPLSFDCIKPLPEHDLFYMSSQTAKRIRILCQEAGADLDSPWYIGEKEDVFYRFRESRELAALERELFRYPYHVYSGEVKDIHIRELKDREEEVCICATTIRRLVRMEGYHYREIAVVAGDVAGYERYIRTIFMKNEIPFFLDQKKHIMDNPLSRMVLGIFKLLQSNFSRESVIDFLRCGLYPVEQSTVDDLENYILALGIRGQKWYEKEWDRHTSTEKEKDLSDINQVRKQLFEDMEPFLSLAKNGGTVEAYSRVLYEQLVTWNCCQTLNERAEQFEKQGEPLLAREYQAVYQILMDLLSHLVEILGSDTTNPQEYGELLEAGLSEGKVGLIPEGSDLVMAGDLERTRLKDIKALFVLGVNDGVIPPSSSGDGGILSDLDRIKLMDVVELAPTNRAKRCSQQFYLYLNLTKPSRKLYLSYVCTDEDGKKISSSYLIGKIRKLYPGLSIEYGEKLMEEEPEYALKENLGRELLYEKLRGVRNSDQYKTDPGILLCWQKEPDYEEMLEFFLSAVFYQNKENHLTGTVAKLLYGTNLKTHVTRLEQYASCAFAHLLNYGLMLKEREEFTLGVPDLGTLFHGAIEHFSRMVKEQNRTFKSLSLESEDAVRNRLAEESVEAVTRDYRNGILNQSSRYAYMVKRLERLTKRTVWALCRQVAAGEMEPVDFEVRFTPYDQIEATDVAVGPDGTMGLSGVIDRIDQYEKDDKCYLKVVDYKSGNKTFDLAQVYYGLELQLVVYLNAATQKLQKKKKTTTVIPAGIYYYHIDDPLLEKLASKEELDTERMKELKMTGLSQRSREILGMMDRAFSEGEDPVKSLVYPVETKKDGNYSAYSQVADTKEFQMLSQYVNEKIQEFGREILSGEASVAPYCYKGKTACDYCSYQGICRFDKKAGGNAYRNLAPLTRDEVWEKVRGQEENHEEKEEGTWQK